MFHLSRNSLILKIKHIVFSGKFIFILAMALLILVFNSAEIFHISNIPDEIYILFKEGTSPQAIEKILSSTNAEITSERPDINSYAIKPYGCGKIILFFTKSLCIREVRKIVDSLRINPTVDFVQEYDGGEVIWPQGLP